MGWQFSKTLEPRAWPPLVDGIYAIILTLLVIDLPSLIFELLQTYNLRPSGYGILAEALITLLGGYLGVFLILYDIWTKKRRLLEVSEHYLKASGLENFLVLLSIYLATLVPSVYHVLLSIRHEHAKSKLQYLLPQVASIEKGEAELSALIFITAIAMIYFLIYIVAARRCRQLKHKLRGEFLAPTERSELQGAMSGLVALKFNTLIRICAAPVFVIMHILSVIPPLPTLCYGLSGLWNRDEKQSGH